LDKNKQVYLNFGLIAVGPLSEIEKLQRLVKEQCEELRVVYQTVSAKKLFLVKKKEVNGNWEKKESKN
jgi:hypothetical protein